MSSCLIAPPGPVPLTVAGSMPRRAASFRAGGEIRSRPETAGTAGATTGSGAAAGGGGETAGARASADAPSSMIARTVPVGTVGARLDEDLLEHAAW